ncbi:FAR1 DNA binding domain, zinc finger, SWIM-type, MULE transposase domain containing protein, partial [Tanacetum coccineum]
LVIQHNVNIKVISLESTQDPVICQNIRSDYIVFTMKMEILLEPTSNKLMVMDQRFNTTAVNPIKKILLKLNLLITSDPHGFEGEDDFKIVKVRDHVGFYVVGKDRTRTWYSDILPHGEKPIQGTQFVSIDQAYSFYVAYGKKARFDVRRGRDYKAVGFGDVTTKYFHCTREGFLSNPKEKSGVKSLDVDISEHSKVSDGFERFRDPKKKQTRRKPTFRCGCLASLTIKRIGNVFEVTSLIEGHNHPLVAEKDMIFMKNSRNIGYTKQHFLYL